MPLSPHPSLTPLCPRHTSQLTPNKTENLCEKDPGVRSFAGYVRLPAGAPYALYEQNIFFWFFEARNDPQNAPLTVWLQGGPAMASTAQVSPLTLLSPPASVTRAPEPV